MAGAVCLHYQKHSHSAAVEATVFASGREDIERLWLQFGKQVILQKLHLPNSDFIASSQIDTTLSEAVLNGSSITSTTRVGMLIRIDVGPKEHVIVQPLAHRSFFCYKPAICYLGGQLYRVWCSYGVK